MDGIYFLFFFHFQLQVYEGLVYMDFSKQIMDENGYGTQSSHLNSDYNKFTL